MSANLFEEFDAVSAKQWKQKIQYDLGGADYNAELVWQSPEGINVKPFYHADDFEKGFPPIPGQPKKWHIAQNIFIADESIARKIALDALSRGTEAIYFSSEKEFDFKKLFLGFPFETTSIYFDLKFLAEEFLLRLINFLSEKNATIFYNLDIIGNLARTGNWFHNLKQDHEILGKILQNNPEKNIISIDAALYQNAGANMLQQLAYALAQANEYLNHFCQPERSRRPADGKFKITFKVAVGSNYFFEMAKIRALRKLYSVLAAEYKLPESCHILAFPSKRNKTIYDYNVNMLRTTTESMSAILGGADAVCSLPYDAPYHKSNEFGERIARNQLLVLKKESYFDTAENAAHGAYYIESLTQQLAEKALVLFKEIEASGGFLKVLKEGTVQKKTKESAGKEQHLFDSGELVLIGTNKHPKPDERMKADLELFPFSKKRNEKTLISPIVEKRLAEETEKVRLENEEQ